MSKNKGQALPYSISQNFLTSRRIIDRLLTHTTIQKSDTVLEIGAGKGHITKALADHAGDVLAYEIDGNLAEKIKPKLPENVRLIQGDFLRCTLPKEKYKVFANIPFSRTTEIVRKLTEASNPPDAAWLIMEKGAAKRFCGQPSENINSLLIKPYFETRICYYLRREDFHPAPRVDCVLIEFIRKPKPDLPSTQKKAFAQFIKKAKQQGIETLLTKKQISIALRMAGLPPVERSGTILYVQWLCLFRCWMQFGKGR
ncbi:MAG: 23S ribosomal RNA methyltransferase Erm [Clostridia bacterium]|nr:23S ribosomal RNA methyltransferase Erm [Clostridia bacterium]